MTSLTTVRTTWAVPWAVVEVMTSVFVPATDVSVRVNVPLPVAVTDVVVVALLLSVATSATSIRACGAAVPVTVMVAPAAVWSVGLVTVSGVLPWVWVMYRSRTTAGCSRSRPAARSAVSRTCDADAQVSGDADPSA